MAVPWTVQCCHRVPVEGNTTSINLLELQMYEQTVDHVPSSSVMFCPGLTSFTLPCKTVLGGCFSVTCTVIPVKSAIFDGELRNRGSGMELTKLLLVARSRVGSAAQFKLYR